MRPLTPPAFLRKTLEHHSKTMKIGIPVENGRLRSHFGGSRHFALIEVDEAVKTIVRSETLPAPEHQPGLLPRWLREQGVQVVITGGIGQRALAIFAQNGIQVLAGQPDAPVETLATAYLAGQLVETAEGCARHHDDHGPEHGHHCHTDATS
jgi:predicted Fe-Mo cluster-binding NifX family protein